MEAFLVKKTVLRLKLRFCQKLSSKRWTRLKRCFSTLLRKYQIVVCTLDQPILNKFQFCSVSLCFIYVYFCWIFSAKTLKTGSHASPRTQFWFLPHQHASCSSLFIHFLCIYTLNLLFLSSPVAFIHTFLLFIHKFISFKQIRITFLYFFAVLYFDLGLKFMWMNFSGSIILEIAEGFGSGHSNAFTLIWWIHVCSVYG